MSPDGESGGSRQRAGEPRVIPSPRLVAGFALYLDRYLARHFDAVRLSRAGAPPADPSGPLVVYSNHPSWWDPMLMLWLHRRFHPGREAYGPMDARALERYPFLERLGIFGVEQGTRRGAATFLATARWILARESAGLWLTAQGHFADPRDRPVELAPGLAHVVARGRRLTVVPLALEYPFWDEKLPQALVRFGPARRVEEGEEADAATWNRRLAADLEATQDALAVEAQDRDPRAFRTLLSGRRGVGGIYELGRRLRAALRGERFVAGHGDRP